MEKENVNIKKDNQGILKAVGQFFYGENLNDSAFVVARGMNGFKVLKETLHGIDLKKKVKSVRWLANFTPNNSGSYTFTINPNTFTHIFIDGKNAKDQEMQLEAERSYTFMVTYFGNPMVEQDELFQLDVNYIFNQQKRKEIEVDSFSSPEIVSFEGVLTEELGKNTRDEEPLLDTDNDGIYDDWEVNGYTVINHVVFPWEDKYDAMGYKKYVSNPNESHTAGDPYSDLEKASGAIDRGINKVAWNPLVAAYPNITVGMENLILSDNKEISSTTGQTVSRTTASSVSTSNTLGIDTNVSASIPAGISSSVTAHYSHTSTHSVDKSRTSGQDWHQQLGIQTGQAGYMNANIRYYNTGTAPVYNMVSTTNLVLGRETIATVTGQQNQKAISLAPGQTFPEKHLHGIALNTLDQFSSTPINININQLDRLEGGERLKLETTQFTGGFARRDPAGGHVVLESNEWAHFIPQIESVTAGILININGTAFIERRIAAKDPENPNDRTPEITLWRALEISVNAKKDTATNKWYFKDEDTGKEYTLNPHLMHFVYDKKTEQAIEQEQEHFKNNIYDMIIRPGMNIQIDIPVLSDDFTDENSNWDGGSYDATNGLNNDQCIKFINEIGFMDLNPDNNTKYLIMVDMKGSGASKVTFSLDQIGTVAEFDITTQYQRLTMMVESFHNGMSSIDLTITSNNNQTIYIDNFSIIKLERIIDNLKEENEDYANEWNLDNLVNFSLSDLENNITNDHDIALVKIEDTNLHQKFHLEYDKTSGAFFIGDIGVINNLLVLTWDRATNRLLFRKNKYTHTQRWFFRKSTGSHPGYNIISLADRSRCLEYINVSENNVNNLQIATLDETTSSQYFLKI